MSRKPIQTDETTGATTDIANFATGNLKVDGVDVGGGSGLTLPGSSTNNAIPKWVGVGADQLADSNVTIDGSNNIAGAVAITASGQVQGATVNATGNITAGGTVDGRDLQTDGSKLDAIEASATADQTDGEIETAYNNQVTAVSQAQAEAGTSTTIQRWTAERIAQAIAALGGGGGGTPGGASGQVQFNDAGAFGAKDTNTFLDFNKANASLLMMDSIREVVVSPLGFGCLNFGRWNSSYNTDPILGDAAASGSLSFGCFAQNDQYGQPTIAASGDGSFAAGYIGFPYTSNTMTCKIEAAGNGAMAFGHAHHQFSNIEAQAHGSLAFGYCDGGSDIIASGVGATQFNEGTNALANSLQVGQFMRLVGNKYYYTGPASRKNGDMWVAYDGGFDAVYIRSRNNDVKMI